MSETTPADSLPEEAVEAVARAICEAIRDGNRYRHEINWTTYKDQYMTQARAAILAYQQAAWCFDMEKAPRDGTPVDIWGRVDTERWTPRTPPSPRRFADCRMTERGTWLGLDNGYKGVAWMLPAPPPPTDKGEK